MTELGTYNDTYSFNLSIVTYEIIDCTAGYEFNDFYIEEEFTYLLGSSLQEIDISGLALTKPSCASLTYTIYTYGYVYTPGFLTINKNAQVLNVFT